MRVTTQLLQVLLLEHGRSSWEWLNRILDQGAPKHAAQWGCVWNRDIRALVENSGLKVNSISTYHFGTTYYIVATPSQEKTPTTQAGEKRASEVGVNKEKGSGLARGGEPATTSSALASALSSVIGPLCVPWLSCSCGRCGSR